MSIFNDGRGYATSKEPRRSILLLTRSLWAAALLGAGPASAQDCVWTLVASGGPSPRQHAAMTYDSRRGVCVLWGGGEGWGALGDTWEWDGQAWRLVATTGPRGHRGMAYDNARARSVVTADNGQTWEWDGSQWALVHSGTGARFLPGMAYDGTRGVVVRFGTASSTYLTNPSVTETWNGIEWRSVAGGSPPPRFLHAMSHDPGRGVTLFHGGRTFGGVFCDTWEWDGRSWLQVAMNIPSPRHGHSMVYHAGIEASVLFGGDALGLGLLAELWAYDGAQWRRLTTGGPSPSPRANHAMAYDSARGVIVLFGGTNGTQDLGDTWELRCTPRCYPDCDTSTGPGTLDVFDLLCFQNRYDQRDPYACDCDTSTGPGDCNVFDFLCFQNAYAAGCP